MARVVLGLGYTPLDLVTTLRGVLRRSDADIQEHLLLEFLGVRFMVTGLHLGFTGHS